MSLTDTRKRQPSYPPNRCKVKGCNRPIEPQLDKHGRWESLQNFRKRGACSPDHAVLLRRQRRKASATRRVKVSPPELEDVFFMVRPNLNERRRQQLKSKIAELGDELKNFAANGYPNDIYSAYARARREQLRRELAELQAS